MDDTWPNWTSVTLPLLGRIAFRFYPVTVTVCHYIVLYMSFYVIICHYNYVIICHYMSLYVIICHCAWLAMPCRWSDGHRFGFCPVSPAHSECLVRQGLHAWPNPPGFVSAWRTERSLNTKQKWNNFRNQESIRQQGQKRSNPDKLSKIMLLLPVCQCSCTSSENCFVCWLFPSVGKMQSAVLKR